MFSNKMYLGCHRFENIKEAAEFFGVSKKTMNYISSEYPIFKKHHHDFFQVQVDGRNFKFIEDVVGEFGLTYNDWQKIIKTKSFEADGETHFVVVPKCISMLYDLKNILGERFNLEESLNHVIRHSNMEIYKEEDEFNYETWEESQLLQMEENAEVFNPGPYSDDSSDEEED